MAGNALHAEHKILMVSVLSMLLIDAAQARVFRCMDADGTAGIRSHRVRPSSRPIICAV